MQGTGQGCPAQEGVSSEGILSGNNPAQGKEEAEAKRGITFAPGEEIFSQTQC